jgi:hypothetical protein
MEATVDPPSRFAVRETRVIECDDPVNYRYGDRRLEQAGSAAASVAEA